jgi:hypothetical protein
MAVLLGDNSATEGFRNDLRSDDHTLVPAQQQTDFKAWAAIAIRLGVGPTTARYWAAGQAVQPLRAAIYPLKNYIVVVR